MTRIKILGLALVAVFAMAAISAAGASAGTNPALFECAKAATKGTGHYESKTCSDTYKSTGGDYVLKEGLGKKNGFKSKGGVATLHTVNPEGEVDIPVTCQKFKGSGEYLNPTTVVNVKTTFSKCKALEAPCENIKKETIETNTLAGTLGWVSKPGKVVGTDLANEAEPGTGYVAEFTCAAIGKIRSFGSVIGINEGNVGTISKTSTLKFSVADYLGEVEYAPGKSYKPLTNVPEFEGGTPDILETEIDGAITGHPGEFYPKGGIPSGQEGTSEQKGEAVGIYEEGSE